MQDLVSNGVTQLAGLMPDSLLWALSRVIARLQDPVFQRDIAKTASIVLVVLLLEIGARKKWKLRYGSKNFRFDVLYFVFYYSGLYHVLVFAWIYRGLTSAVQTHAPWLQLELLADTPLLLQVVAVIVIFDFVGYWSHRWRHANRFLWEFHAVHHSQTVLTPMSNYRFHLVDETVLRLCVFLPFQIVGATTIEIWLLLDFLMAWVLLVQHSEWSWTYGRLGRIVVSPAFHRMHHSRDLVHQNSNYAMLFSFWDDLFGTAERKAPLPRLHGLSDSNLDGSFAGQMLRPFTNALAQWRAPVKPVPSESPAGPAD
jgi:sterol desaturase/sphingolipid hydroxylase (fatty acid hydroxylase superfamily)